MEKDNKYYEIIENLVKGHKKFNGYEAILDDIIDDVYSHSEVILNTVDNEQVIQSYLEKVVSTSIITVPKKLNFSKSIKHAVINPILPEPLKNDIIQNRDNLEAELDLTDKLTESIEIEPKIQENEDMEIHLESNTVEEIEDANETDDFITVNNELVDKMINLPDSSLTTEETVSTQDGPVYSFETEEPAQDTQFTNELEPETIINNEDEVEEISVNSADNTDFLQEVQDNTEFVPADDIIDSDNQDNELSDVNTVEWDIQDNEPSGDNSIELDIQNDEFSSDNTIELNIQEEELSDINSAESETQNNEFPSDDTNELNIQDNDLSEETSFENISFTQESELYSTNNTDENETIFENIDDIQNVDTEFSELAEQDTNLLEENDSDIIMEDFSEVDNELQLDDINIEPSDSNEFAEDSFELKSFEIQDENSVSTEDSNGFFNTIETEESGLKEETSENDYRFYTRITLPSQDSKNEYDLDNITENILKLASETQQIDIAQLFELKYKQNKNVDEIASELNTSVEDVIEGLNKLISVL